MNQVEISIAGIETPPWLSRVELFCLKSLEYLEITNWEVSILLCNDEFIHDLNYRFRQQDSPTDVLTFSQSGLEHNWSSEDDEDIIRNIIKSQNLLLLI